MPTGDSPTTGAFGSLGRKKYVREKDPLLRLRNWDPGSPAHATLQRNLFTDSPRWILCGAKCGDDWWFPQGNSVFSALRSIFCGPCRIFSPAIHFLRPLQKFFAPAGRFVSTISQRKSLFLAVESNFPGPAGPSVGILYFFGFDSNRLVFGGQNFLKIKKKDILRMGDEGRDGMEDGLENGESTTMLFLPEMIL